MASRFLHAALIPAKLECLSNSTIAPLSPSSDVADSIWSIDLPPYIALANFRPGIAGDRTRVRFRIDKVRLAQEQSRPLAKSESRQNIQVNVFEYREVRAETSPRATQEHALSKSGN